MTGFSFAHREEGFDKHIESSIRGYNHLINDVISMGRHFIEEDTDVVDIGCSTGKLTEAIALCHTKDAKYVGFEIEEGFMDEMRGREKSLEEQGYWCKFYKQDVREYSFNNCSYITSLFTLQFISKKDRLKVIKNIYKGLNDGGAFVFAEKTMCDRGIAQDILTFNHYDFKRKTFDCKDIMDKEQELRSMMKPNTWNEIESMLYNAGFKIVQPFWRNHAFVAALAIK